MIGVLIGCALLLAWLVADAVRREMERQRAAYERAGLERLYRAVKALPVEDPARLVIEPKPETFATAMMRFQNEHYQRAVELWKASFNCDAIARECAAARAAGRN